MPAGRSSGVEVVYWQSQMLLKLSKNVCMLEPNNGNLGKIFDELMCKRNAQH